MANVTKRQKVRDLAGGGAKNGPAPVFIPRDETVEFLNLLANAFELTDEMGEPLPDKTQRRVKSLLLNDGEAGYDPITAKWYKASPAGVLDADGDYTRVYLTAANGKQFQRPAAWGPDDNGAYVFKALPYGGVTFAEIVEDACGIMHLCDVASVQNLEACKTPYIVSCRDADMLLSIKQAIQQKEAGCPAIVVSGDLADGLKAIAIETPFLADRYEYFRDHKRAELLTKLGVLTANTTKRERVQSAEVNAKLGEASDYIYLLIDNFNRQAISYGLPFRASYNGSMEEIYEDGDEEAVTDQDDEAQGGAQND